MSSRVDILLSAYNGERYLAEQLESILGQTHADFILTIRDDGSRDGTPDLLTGYARRDSRITLQLQDNLGVVGSFHRLLRDADPGCGYFAFADQDDVWLPNKLERALSVLSRYDDNEPLLYCAGLEYVSSDLNHLGFSAKIGRAPCLGNALVQNIATGCTMVMNRTARELLLKHDWPSHIVMHDWWCYLVVSAFGKVIRDDFVALKYRQHEGNQVGVSVSFISNCRKRITNYMSRSRQGFHKTCYLQATVLMQNYGDDLAGENREVVRRFIDSKRSLLCRLRYLVHKQRAFRMTLFDDVLLRLMILANKY